MYNPLLWSTLISVAPVKVTDDIPTLSLTYVLKLTVCPLLLVLTVILLFVAFVVRLVIEGFWLSLLLILTVTLAVDVLPAASVATIETVSVLEPKL